VSINDEAAISTLIARIAQLADDGELGDYVGCFTPDARWDMPGAPRRGHAQILAGGQERRATGATGPGSSTRHLVTTIALTVDGEIAQASSYWQFYAMTAASPELQAMGRYDDTFVRTDAGWRLDHRVITFG
jgi:3-phenylpropionate/cinnamic acid dioxygenase small subunit